MVRALIGLGSNQGDRAALLQQAVERLAQPPRIVVHTVSPFIETKPAGGALGQGPFLNAAALVETSLAPESLLAVLKEIEQELGRTPDERWAARPIDLDLLLFAEETVDTPALTVPHPRMAWRRFVIEPAAAIAGDMIHPTTGWTITRLAAHLHDTRPYLALTGLSQTVRTEVAWHLVSLCGGHLVSAAELPPPGIGAAIRLPQSATESLESAFTEAVAALHAAAQQPSDRLLVGDFWYGEWRAMARACVPAGALGQFEARWRSHRDKVLPPRLVVLLDTVPDEEEDELFALLRRSLLKELAKSDVGPVMRLTGLSMEAAVAEVAAAVESM